MNQCRQPQRLQANENRYLINPTRPTISRFLALKKGYVKGNVLKNYPTGQKCKAHETQPHEYHANEKPIPF